MVENISSLSNAQKAVNERAKNLDAVDYQSKPKETGEIDQQGQVSTDVVELSEPLKAELERSEFDADKVERIKDAIANGQYPLDNKRIAESFAAIEKLI